MNRMHPKKAEYKCIVSPVAKANDVNTVVAMRDVMQMCCVGYSIQIELTVAAVAELFTHCQAVQAMTNFDNLNQSTQARIKNCKLFGKISFVCSSHACTREFLGWALTMLRVVQAYLKHCPSLCEAVVKTKLWSKSLLYSATNKFAYASIERCTRSTQAVFVFFALLLHA